jgi:hypothetical protein
MCRPGVANRNEVDRYRQSVSRPASRKRLPPKTRGRLESGTTPLQFLNQAKMLPVR